MPNGVCSGVEWQGTERIQLLSFDFAPYFPRMSRVQVVSDYTIEYATEWNPKNKIILPVSYSFLLGC